VFYFREDLDDLKDIEEALASPIKKKKPTSSKATTSIDENAAPSKKTRKVRIKEEIQQEKVVLTFYFSKHSFYA
jgi:hypothetical protein